MCTSSAESFVIFHLASWEAPFSPDRAVMEAMNMFKVNLLKLKMCFSDQLSQALILLIWSGKSGINFIKLVATNKCIPFEGRYVCK